MELTPLERAVLDWIAVNAHDPAIAAQLRSAEPTSREFTGSGSYTTLRVPDGTPSTAHRVAPTDPYIESPELEAGGGAVLFFEEGRATTLELYAYGSTFPHNLSTWRLIDGRARRMRRVDSQPLQWPAGQSGSPQIGSHPSA